MHFFSLPSIRSCHGHVWKTKSVYYSSVYFYRLSSKMGLTVSERGLRRTLAMQTTFCFFSVKMPIVML